MLSDRLALAGDQAFSQREGVELHRPRLDRRAAGRDLVGAVVVVGHVERLAVGTQAPYRPIPTWT
jgi:hypothetical protein